MEMDIVIGNLENSVDRVSGNLSEAKMVYKDLCPPRNRYLLLTQELFTTGIDFSKPVVQVGRELCTELERRLLLALRKNARLFDEYVLIRSHHNELGISVKEFSESYCASLNCDVRALPKARLQESLQVNLGDLRGLSDAEVYAAFNDQEVDLFGLSIRLYDIKSMNAHLAFCGSDLRLFAGPELGSLILASAGLKTKDDIVVLGSERWSSPSVSLSHTALGTSKNDSWFVRGDSVDRVVSSKWKRNFSMVAAQAADVGVIETTLLQKVVQHLGCNDERAVLGFIRKEMIRSNCAYLRGIKNSVNSLQEQAVSDASVLYAMSAAFTENQGVLVGAALCLITQADPQWRYLMKAGLRDVRCLLFLSNKNFKDSARLHSSIFMLLPIAIAMNFRTGVLDLEELQEMIKLFRSCICKSLLDLAHDVKKYMQGLKREIDGKSLLAIKQEFDKLAQVDLEEPVIEAMDNFHTNFVKRIAEALNLSGFCGLDQWFFNLINAEDIS